MYSATNTTQPFILLTAFYLRTFVIKILKKKQLGKSAAFFPTGQALVQASVLKAIQFQMKPEYSCLQLRN